MGQWGKSGYLISGSLVRAMLYIQGTKIICTNVGWLNDLPLIRFGLIFGAFCSADPDNVANPIYQWQSRIDRTMEVR